MPKRTNLFQQVVTVIYEHLADGASMESSAELLNRFTGKKREVDVVLRTKAAGHELVIGIEATSRQSKPASVEWVEDMVGKHKNLPTDKVILISESGFTEQARDLAIKEYMVPISPEILGAGDPTFKIVNAVRSLWPKQVNLTPERYRVLVDFPGEGVIAFLAPDNLDVFAEDGSFVPLKPIVQALIEGHWPQIIQQIDLVNIEEDFDGFAVIGVGPDWTIKVDGEQHYLYVRYVEGEKTELQRIDGLEITAKAEIRVAEIAMHHRRLAEIGVSYSYGEGYIGSTPALIVATESSDGSRVSLQLNPKHIKKKSAS
ncbi:restriction endonuclease [Nocardia sp. CA-119907]|uniref:restriction endonuclease n=1 Tax=Nocardia sp. CA-119907 TaxID=3239973 RepID=UPI003D95F8E5